ncbi:ATP-binding protein [Paenibacillus sp. GCM10012307]|uniref:Heme sensor protein HssS n=1 Tax=Paenibacillus roseus TaxID=2798579 RepID=A0A934J186_9BACL|nr:HAMP domain-containing sensor histidine kinase [Paenibacillus roseus]MBJ6361439.1 HAMP domain-containing protein [Paenibacillus roseus]
MIRTLYIRVVLTFLAVIIIALVSSFLVSFMIFQKELKDIQIKEMTTAAEDMIRVYQQTPDKDQDPFMMNIVKLLSFPARIYNAEGEVKVYGWTPDKKGQGVLPEHVQQVLSGKPYWSEHDNEIKFGGLPFEYKGESYALFIKPTGQNANTIIRLFFTILGLVLGIGSLCILIAARYLVKPLKVMTKATKRLAKGDFDVELQMKRKDEFGTLAQSFDEMAKELKQLEQMRQDFVSNVSHEIQSPLTSISGFAKALKLDNLVTEEKRNHYLDIILKESERLSRLSDNLLKLASLDSRQHPFQLQTFNLDEQIRQIMVVCEPLCKAKNIQMDLWSPPALKITADADQLNQVWMNLIGNSIKFTPEGGHILIDIRCNTEEYIVTIKDSGIGIAVEELKHIFERFYKTDRSRDRAINGNGLGLAIVKKIISLHHGRIEAKSSIGEGSTFVVTLPRVFSTSDSAAKL